MKQEVAFLGPRGRSMAVVAVGTGQCLPVLQPAAFAAPAFEATAFAAAAAAAVMLEQQVAVLRISTHMTAATQQETQCGQLCVPG